MYRKSPLVSIIIPVYNGEKTIERCIKSILDQNIHNMEVIVVNDGSTDNTMNILEHYGEIDNIVLISQKNMGVSAARNIGMKYAAGKWISFVDADDYLEPDCFKTVFSYDNLEKYDLVFWNYYRVTPSKKSSSAIMQRQKKEYNREELFLYVLDNKGKQCLSSVYCRLFQRELILKYELLFQENVISNEDRIFMLDYLMYSEKCLGLAECLYNRTLNVDSAIHRWHQNAKEEYLLTARMLKERLLHNEVWNICQNVFYIWILQDIISLYLETYLCHIQNTASKKKRKKELYLFIREDIIMEALKRIKYNELPARTIIKYMAVKHGWMKLLDKWYRNKVYFT